MKSIKTNASIASSQTNNTIKLKESLVDWMKMNLVQASDILYENNPQYNLEEPKLSSGNDKETP